MLWFQFSVGAALQQDNSNDVAPNGESLTRQKPRALSFTGEKPSTPILDTINYPNHMKNLSVEVTYKLIHSSIYIFMHPKS